MMPWDVHPELERSTTPALLTIGPPTRPRHQAHFDTYPNLIALISGYRRIVIAPPSECPLLSVSQ